MEISPEYLKDVAFWVGMVIGLIMFYRLGNWVVKFLGAQLLAILKSLQDAVKGILAVLAKVEANQEAQQKTNEIMEKRVTRLEDTVYSNLSKATRK